MSKVLKDVVNEFVRKIVTSGKFVFDEEGKPAHVVEIKKVAALWREAFQEIEKLESNQKE